MNFKQLLETYTIEEVLEHIELEPVELLELLEEYGYSFETLVEPLE